MADAKAALRYLESGSAVDVLFTDINLAGEMDGSMLAARVREQRPELPIVYCSGRYSPSALRRRCRARSSCTSPTTRSTCARCSSGSRRRTEKRAPGADHGNVTAAINLYTDKQSDTSTTPLPAAAWMFGSVLAGGAGIDRWRKRRKAA